MIDSHVSLAYLQYRHGEEAPPPHTGMTVVRADALTGMPLRLALDAGHGAILVLPTGSAYAWQTAPAGQLVTESALDRSFPAGLLAEDQQDAGAVLAERTEPSARVLVTRDRSRIGSLPLRAGVRGRFPSSGAAEIEIEIVDFRIEAGSVRGAPALGTFLTLAWRPMTAEAVAPPPEVTTETVRALAAMQKVRKPLRLLPHRGFDTARIYRLNRDV